MLRKAVSLQNSPCVALVVAAGLCLSVVPWSWAGIQPGAPEQPGVKQPEIQQDDQPAVQPDRKPKALTVPVVGDSNIPASGGIKPSPAIARLISAAYLTDAERQDLRIKHGVFTADDLDTPQRRASAALVVGNYDDAVLDDPSVAPLDRAEALLQRGKSAAVIALLGTLDEPAGRSPRAVRIKALAYEATGNAAGAAIAARVAYEDLISGKLTSAADVANAAAATVVMFRASGTKSPQADLGGLMSLLRKARTLDPLEPLVGQVEAELLVDRDNFAQAQEALSESLSLCPMNAQSMYLLGTMAISAFDMPNAEKIAVQIEQTAATARGGGMAVSVPHALAAQIRAKAMLRQNDPDLASSAIAPAQAVFPDRFELQELDAAIAAVRYDFAGAQAMLDAYDKRAPGSARALMIAGKALAEARQYDQSAVWLREAGKRAPHWNQPAIELGLLQMQAGRDEESQQALERAFKLDPFNVRADNSLRLLKDLRGYTRVSSDHFIVRAKPGIDAALAAEMLPVLENMFRIVTGGSPGDGQPGLRHVPANKTLIDMAPNHAQFAVRITGLGRIHTIAASTGPVIAMEAPRDGPGHTGTYDWERVLRHEYTHTVGLSRTGNRVPHWFTEAQAVYLELSPRDYQTVELLTRVYEADEFFDFTEINIAFTRPKKPTDRQQAYAQGHWMYQYIVERFGLDAPLALMDQFAKGVREPEAFLSVLGLAREQFFVDFKVYAKKQLIEWGMILPEGTPTLAVMAKELDGDVQVDVRAEPEAEAPGDEPDMPATDAKPATPAKPDGRAADDAQPINPGKPNIMPGIGRDGPAKPNFVKLLSDDQIETLLAKYPTHPDLLELAVRKQMQAAGDQPAESMRPLLERYAAARPVDPFPQRVLARLALASATPADAILHLKYLDVREDKLPIYSVQLAQIQAQAGNWSKASVHVERAVRMAPYLSTTRELAATIAIKNNDLAAALRHAEFLALLEPDRTIHKQRVEAIRKLAGG